MSDSRGDEITEMADRIFDFVLELRDELGIKKEGSASICSQACAQTAIMLVESAYGKPPESEEDVMVIAKRFSAAYNDLAVRLADYARAYGAGVSLRGPNDEILS